MRIGFFIWACWMIGLGLVQSAKYVIGGYPNWKVPVAYSGMIALGATLILIILEVL